MFSDWTVKLTMTEWTNISFRPNCTKLKGWYSRAARSILPNTYVFAREWFYNSHPSFTPLKLLCLYQDSHTGRQYQNPSQEAGALISSAKATEVYSKLQLCSWRPQEQTTSQLLQKILETVGHLPSILLCLIHRTPKPTKYGQCHTST